jgi:hypothetical protein
MWSCGSLPQAPGAGHEPLTPHFWELNISPRADAKRLFSPTVGVGAAVGGVPLPAPA